MKLDHFVVNIDKKYQKDEKISEKSVIAFLMNQNGGKLQEDLKYRIYG